MTGNKWKVGIIGLVLSLGITACGTKPISMDETEAAKEVINKMEEAAEDCMVTCLECKTELVSKVRRGLMVKDWKVIIDTTSQYDRENFVSLSESLITNFLENKEKTEVKSYMISEEDKLYTYRLVDGEEWFKHDSKIKAEDISKNLVDGPDWENVEILGIDKKKHTINGRDNYKLTVKLAGNGTRDLIFESGIRNFYWNTEYGTLDLQDVIMKAEYYVDCETYRVSKLVVSFDEMQPVITRQAEVGYAGYADMQFKECKMVYDNINYEPVKVPKMSFEDKKNTKEVLQEDVVISIEEHENAAQIQCYDHWTVMTRKFPMRK